MKLKCKLLCAILLSVSLSVRLTQTSSIMAEISSVVVLAKDVIAAVSETWHILDDPHISGDVPLPFIKNQRNIIKKIASVSDDINDMENTVSTHLIYDKRYLHKIKMTQCSYFQIINTAAFTVDRLQSFIRANSEFHTQLLALSDSVNRISMEMEKMRNYAQNVSLIERYTLEDFATWAVSHNPNSVQGLLDKIYLITNGNPDLRSFGSQGFYQIFLQYFEVIKSFIACVLLNRILSTEIPASGLNSHIINKCNVISRSCIHIPMNLH